MRRRVLFTLLGCTTVVGGLAQPAAARAADDPEPLGGLARAVVAASQDYSLPHFYCELLDIDTIEGQDCSFTVRTFRVGAELKGFYVAPGTIDEAFPIVIGRSVEDRLYLYRTSSQGLLLKAVRAVESSQPRILNTEDALQPFSDEVQFWHSKEQEIGVGPTPQQ